MNKKIKRILAAALAAITMTTAMTSTVSAIESPLNDSDNTVEPAAAGQSNTRTVTYTFTELYGLNTPYIGAYAYARSKTTNLTNVTRRITSETAIVKSNGEVLNSASQWSNQGLNGIVQSTVSYSEMLNYVSRSKHSFSIHATTEKDSAVLAKASFYLDFMAN